jgi:hypothetical protein
LRLLERRPLTQAPDRAEPATPALGGIRRPAIRAYHRRREPDVRVERDPLEPWPHDADDRKGTIVERQRPPDKAGVSAESRTPHGVADHDDRIGVRYRILRRSEHAADLRRRAKHREVRR